MKLWENRTEEVYKGSVLEYYPATEKKSDGAVVIFPGGGYTHLAEHEGKGYAELLNTFGIDAFVLKYRVSPNRFPLPLLDARRSVRFVRYNAEKYGINPNKIAVMGSSAGGHLASLLSTYKEKIEFEGIDETDKMDFIPNFQVLCYPVVEFSDLKTAHYGSIVNLLGEENVTNSAKYNPILLADENTPPAFIWHTAADNSVNVKNSLLYGEKLRDMGVGFEMHIFPDGRHGLGTAEEIPYVHKWVRLLKEWLTYVNFIDA